MCGQTKQAAVVGSFKVGDKVRVVAYPSADWAPLGHPGEVVEVLRDFYRVKTGMDSGLSGHLYITSELELAPAETPKIHLELTQAEAEALLVMVGRGAGSVTKSPNKYIQRIGERLRGMGVEWDPMHYRNDGGAVRFFDYPAKKAPAETPQLKVGDTIEFLKDYTSLCKKGMRTTLTREETPGILSGINPGCPGASLFVACGSLGSRFKIVPKEAPAETPQLKVGDIIEFLRDYAGFVPKGEKVTLTKQLCPGAFLTSHKSGYIQVGQKLGLGEAFKLVPKATKRVPKVGDCVRITKVIGEDVYAVGDIGVVSQDPTHPVHIRAIFKGRDWSIGNQACKFDLI